MRKILCNLLFRVLNRDLDIKDIDDKIIEDWLLRQSKDRGFHEYFRKRDLQMLKIFGTGLSDESATIWRGQRLELLYLMSEIKKRSEKQSNKK